MGKDKKGSKRGGKIYIENAEEMEIQEAKFRENQLERAKRRQEEDDDDEEDKNNNEVDQEVVESVAKVSITKAKPEVTKSKSIIQNDPMQTEEVGMSRREREAIEAIERKAEYDRRHLAGETEQAKADLARLAIVKQRREEARLKREAEGRAPGYSARGIESSSEDEDSDEDNNVKTAPVAVAAPVLSEVAAKKKAIATAEVTDKGVDTETKLKAIDIKKMNADALKEHLKARNLDIQGQKKDLMKRLIDYEAAR